MPLQRNVEPTILPGDRPVPKMFFSFCRLKGTGEETKIRNHQRRYQGQAQEPCIS